MRKELEGLYLPTCEACQQNKALTKKPTGPLHPLPVPDGCGESAAIDFISPLPEDDGFNAICTMTDHLSVEFRAILTRMDSSAEDFALLFFTHWYCENGLPANIMSDHDKLFMSRFWKALHHLTGVSLKMSSSYHPETDGSSECSNKTLIQSLRYHVARNQKGWAHALPMVRFNYMNTINASTGFTPFQLHLGCSPRLIPPLCASDTPHMKDIDASAAQKILDGIETDMLEAQDNLIFVKTQQAHYANRSCGPEHVYKIGDKVLLSTFHRRHEFMQRSNK